MCFSLILLSVDLSSPHVKNKMSKREFIRNTRGAVGAEGDNRCFLLHIVKTSVDASPTVSHNHEKKNNYLQWDVAWRKTCTAAFMTTFS